ncbi:MAG: M14 family metallocarboxypeptidase [Chthoniobacteraceae bacterium]
MRKKETARDMENKSAFRKIRSEVVKHRSHDYRHLVQRWRDVARASGVRMRSYATTPDYKLYYLKTKSLGVKGGLYISAGIHGDEPAGVEALITWAEKNIHILSELPCLLFPCLNPWGLINNRRTDQNGVDLNRIFHLKNLPSIEAMKQLIEPHHFAASLMLHEDYDGQGLYLYETEFAVPFWGEKFLKAARSVIPIDNRIRIDGRKQLKPGIVRRKINMKRFLSFGIPEALHLHIEHSDRTFTIETPSEFALDQRVAAHMAVLDECLRLVMGKRG